MTVTLPPLEPWQQDVMNYFDQNPKNKWIIVKAVRQVGKSLLAQLLLIKASLLQGGSVSISVSPVLSQARKMYEDICNIARRLIKKSNGSTLEITFINGSKILFRSGEQSDTIRGLTVKGSGILIGDEAAFVKDSLFYEILVATTNVNKSDIFLFSTPKLKKGVFYDLYIRGLSDDQKIKSFDWTVYDTSKYLPPETLEMYRQQMPKLAFQSEFLGQFIDAEGTVFSDFKECVQETTANKELPIYIGIDWGSGTGNDYTVLTVGQYDNKVNVIEQIAFNDKTSNDTIDYIAEIVEKYSEHPEVNITVEKNSIGNVFFSLLNDRVDCNLQTFNTTNKSKNRIINQLINLFEKRLINIPDDQKLTVELSAYECKANNNGLITYNAKNGFHDDRIMSLAILVNSLYYEFNFN